jgi:hypothetical protein
VSAAGVVQEVQKRHTVCTDLALHAAVVAQYATRLTAELVRLHRHVRQVAQLRLLAQQLHMAVATGKRQKHFFVNGKRLCTHTMLH